MSKRPKHQKPTTQPAHRSLLARGAIYLFDTLKANPITSIAAIVGIFVGIPGVVSAAVYLSGALEPKWYASHEWVREWGAPILKTQNTQALSFDRFLLYQQQQGVAATKNDPGYGASPKLKEQAEDLEGAVKDTKSRICKATGTAKDCN
jgi:hypothetical protein